MLVFAAPSTLKGHYWERVSKIKVLKEVDTARKKLY
jgi:hypothetical protein